MMRTRQICFAAIEIFGRNINLIYKDKGIPRNGDISIFPIVASENLYISDSTDIGVETERSIEKLVEY